MWKKLSLVLFQSVEWIAFSLYLSYTAKAAERSGKRVKATTPEELPISICPIKKWYEHSESCDVRVLPYGYLATFDETNTAGSVGSLVSPWNSDEFKVEKQSLHYSELWSRPCRGSRSQTTYYQRVSIAIKIVARTMTWCSRETITKSSLHFPNEKKKIKIIRASEHCMTAGDKRQIIILKHLIKTNLMH